MNEHGPQFSMRTVLRPYSTFATNYQGVDASTNYIPLTPDAVALDERAGTAGYDADLIRGLPVPEGARIIVHLPFLLASEVVGEATLTTPYVYRFIWRSRSLADINNGRQAASHDPSEMSGVPDGIRPRYPMAATSNAIVYNSNEPNTPVTAVQTLHCEEIMVAGDPAVTMLAPSGTVAAVQQGMEVANGRLHVLPRWVGYSTVALSDELIVAVRRPSIGGADNWGFAANETDYDFGVFYTSYLGWGVIVEVGQAAT